MMQHFILLTLCLLTCAPATSSAAAAAVVSNGRRESPISLCDAEHEFQCNDGLCIPIERQCDNLPDCSNGEDEKECSYLHPCQPGLFMCHSGECEPRETRCNGISDCTDGSDEKGCDEKPKVPLVPVTPSPVVVSTSRRQQLSLCHPDNEIECSDGTCLSIEHICDNVPDCSHGEDEMDCHYLHKCPVNFFMCKSGECEPRAAKCNGISDCPDGSDEKSCDGLPKSWSAPLAISTPTPDAVPEMYGKRDSDFWAILFLICIFVVLFCVFLFLLCNRYPQIRHRRDLVVERVASAINLNRKPASPFASPERKPMVSSVANPVFA